MKALSYLKDSEFLRALDNNNNKFYWVKIEVLDMNEYPLKSIEGRVQPGSTININGDSAVRRTCNISIVAEEAENDLTDIDNLLSINKKIKLFEGIKNNITNKYDDIIWFPLGVFVINDPSISHDISSATISLSCQDKMCLLNGTCGGGLPTSVTFDSYDQVIGKTITDRDPARISDLEPNNYTVYQYEEDNVIKYKTWDKNTSWVEQNDDSLVGKRISVPQRLYDIIQTLVCNYGGESFDKIFINDVPLEIKQAVRYIGNEILYYNSATGFYTTDNSYITEDGTWKGYSFNEDVGYIYTDFVYPGSLVSNIGDNVGSILEQIKNTLGNYEYFYDVEGNFVFQEIKNYLNTSYDATDSYRLDNGRTVELASNGLCVLDGSSYQVDFYSNTKSVYTFSEGNGLISTFSNSPYYSNIKNDFHIWGTQENETPIHYHIAIKNKPIVMNSYRVIYLKENEEYTGRIRLANIDEIPDDINYIPEDWRAELYLRGLQKQQNQQRPDIYEQELLDLFDNIYNFKEKSFKVDLVENPNNLTYFFDYLEPIDKMYDCSVDVLQPKVYSYQQDKINKIFNVDIPNIIMINMDMDPNYRKELINRCEREGQPYSNIDNNIYTNITEGLSGYNAEDAARTLLYQYTNYNESISLNSVPIYYLDVNSRITVQDRKIGIYGDYIIKSISLPLNAEGTMSITASRALERI